MEAPGVESDKLTDWAEVNVPPPGLKVGAAAVGVMVVPPPPPLPQPAIQTAVKTAARIPVRLSIQSSPICCGTHLSRTSREDESLFFDFLQSGVCDPVKGPSAASPAFRADSACHSADVHPSLKTNGFLMRLEVDQLVHGRELSASRWNTVKDEKIRFV
jgi:hypothetical protein